MGRYYRDKLGQEQQRIFNRMVNGENIFLTGNAGTGKSFLVEAYNEYCVENEIKILKTAPTGIAACNIGGVTIHREFGLPIDTKKILKREMALPSELGKRLNLASVLLIDEISMVRIDVFDKIMNYIELANAERRTQKRKEIQLIFVGDFYQLAPVIPEADRKELSRHYGMDIGSGFAFQSKYWQSLKIQFEKLTEVRRQDGDKEFCTALDMCKEGDKDCLPFFANKTAKEKNENAIWVCGKNSTAAEKNRAKLDKIQEEVHVFEAEYNGDAKPSDKLCDDEFICKKNARVIMLVNDRSDRFKNGSTGTITGFCDEGIYVDIDQRDDDPLSILVEPHDFCKYEYRTRDVLTETKNERGETVIKKTQELVLVETGSVKQYPMKLGFAITVHKAQGQTYDEMNFEPEIFQDGQLYVALSRCRSADKLYIASPLSHRMVRAAQEVVKYYKNPENYTFFGHEKDIVSVQISLQSKEYVNIINKYCDDEEFRSGFLDYITEYEHKKEQKMKQEEQEKTLTKTGWGSSSKELNSSVWGVSDDKEQLQFAI